MEKVRLPAQHNQAQRWGENTSSPPSALGLTTGFVCNPVSPADLERPCPTGKRRHSAWSRHFYLWLSVVLLSLVTYSLFNRFLFTSVVVQGKSMLPTLLEGEHYFLDRWSYRHHDPARGDLVVLHDPGHSDYAVKRIVGLPGETVRLSGGSVYINNQLFREPYLPKGLQTLVPGREEEFFELGKDEYFVLGDNRMLSEDSRHYGPVTRAQIAGNLLLGASIGVENPLGYGHD